MHKSFLYFLGRRRGRRLVQGSRKTDRGFLIARTALCALFMGLPFSQPANLLAKPLALYEKERSLVVLPLFNATEVSDLDYLSQGLAKVLGSRLANLSYVQIRHAKQVFLVNPQGQDLKSYHDRNSYLPQLRPRLLARARRLRLKSRILYLDKKNYKAWNERSIERQAYRLKADYLLKGSYGLASPYSPEERYQLSRKAIKIRLQLYNAQSGSSTYFSLITKIENVYQHAPRLASSVKTALLGKQDATIKVESPQKGAMVFVDDLYLGRTPIEARLISGAYTLRVSQDGKKDYIKKIQLKKNQQLALQANLKPSPMGGNLHVTSSPSGAKVYLDWRLIGKTPLLRGDLPVGAHRLRLSLPGHIDRIQGIEIQSGKSQSLSFVLEPGNTQTAFLDPNYALFDWSYYDLSFYSFLGSLAFYGSYVALDSQAQNIRQSIRTSVQGLSIFERIASLQSSPALYAYEWSLLEANAKRAEQVQRQANASAGLSGALLLAAGYFFYRAVLEDSQRDNPEISWFWESKTGAAFSMRLSSRNTASPPHSPQAIFLPTLIEVRHSLGWQIRF